MQIIVYRRVFKAKDPQFTKDNKMSTNLPSFVVSVDTLHYVGLVLMVLCHYDQFNGFVDATCKLNI